MSFKMRMICVAWSVLVLLSAGVASAGAVEERPNILLIVADDLGWADLGFQGSKDIKSPNIDRLAAGGIRFTDAHVTASVCSPSRAGMLTGRDAAIGGFAHDRLIGQHHIA